jgi:hypothetical protein
MKDLQTVLDALERLSKRDNWKPFTPDVGCESDPWKPAEQYGLEAIAIVRKLMQAKPVSYQFQTAKDGKWNEFLSDKHYKNTVEDGSYPIRPLFAAPQAVPAHLEEQPDGSVVDTRSEPQAVPEYVQRVVIPFESSLPYERNTA